MTTTPAPVAARSAWLSSLLIGSLALVGCGQGDVDTQDRAIELTKVDPSTLLNAKYAAPYYPSMLEADLDPLQISYPVALTQSFSEDTSKGDCFLNHAEVGSGVRLGGTFKIDQTIKISGWSVDFSPSDRARNPFLVEISFSLGDVTLVSQGDVDISVPCLGLDQKLTVKLNGVRATVVLGAPSTASPASSTGRWPSCSRRSSTRTPTATASRPRSSRRSAAASRSWRPSPTCSSSATWASARRSTRSTTTTRRPA